MTTTTTNERVHTVTAPSGRTFTMGRIVVPDERDRLFSMAAVAPKSAPSAAKEWTVGPVLDQHQTPHCVAFAWAQFLQSEPIETVLKKLGGGAFISRLYTASRKLDGITGHQGGSSVRGGAKAVQEDGRLTSYVWGHDVDTIRRFILSVGPVVMGTDWYEGMFDPTPDGYLVPSGHVAGGHAWLLVGYEPARDAFKMVNSWGAGWGNNGTAFVRSGDLHTLLVNGEACSAVEYVPGVPGVLDTQPRKRKTVVNVNAPQAENVAVVATDVEAEALPEAAPRDVKPKRGARRSGR